MANGDSDGFLWILAIGASIWAWSNHEKLKSERDERIVAVQRATNQASDLETRIIALEREVDFAEGDLKNVLTAHESLRRTVNTNVEIENRAKVARMTAQGACGTETVRYDDGGWSVRNKECTLKDLK